MVMQILSSCLHVNDGDDRTDTWEVASHFSSSLSWRCTETVFYCLECNWRWSKQFACHKDIRRGDTAPFILNLGTRWRIMYSFTLRPLYLQRKSSQYPLNKKLGGRQRRHECFRDENLCYPPDNETCCLCCTARSLATIRTALHRLPILYIYFIISIFLTRQHV